MNVACSKENEENRKRKLGVKDEEEHSVQDKEENNYNQKLKQR